MYFQFKTQKLLEVLWLFGKFAEIRGNFSEINTSIFTWWLQRIKKAHFETIPIQNLKQNNYEQTQSFENVLKLSTIFQAFHRQLHCSQQFFESNRNFVACSTNGSFWEVWSSFVTVYFVMFKHWWCWAVFGWKFKQHFLCTLINVNVKKNELVELSSPIPVQQTLNYILKPVTDVLLRCYIFFCYHSLALSLTSVCAYIYKL